MSGDLAATPVARDSRTTPARLEIAANDESRLRFNSASRLAFVLIVCVFAAVRIWRLTAYGLFSDEVFSAETVHRLWPQMQRAIVTDVVHPPLFYYLLKIWIVFSDSLLWMKLFPVLFALLAIIPLVLLGHELKLCPATINLTLWLMAVNEYLINYAQELRMYSMVLLFATASMWLFAKWINRDKNTRMVQAGLFAANLLLVYTHYYGWLIVGSELLFLIIKRRDRVLAFTLSLVGLIVAFFPWMFAVAKAAQNKGGLGPNLKWNARPSAIDFFQHYVTLNGPIYNSWRVYATVFSSVIFFAPILVWAWRRSAEQGGNLIIREEVVRVANDPSISRFQVSETDEGKQADGSLLLWLALLAFLPSIIAFAASYLLKQSVWGGRFLIVVAPAYFLLVAIAVMRLRPRRLRLATAVLVAAWAALSGILQLTHRDKINWQPLVEQMIQHEAALSGQIRVYATQGVVGTTIKYYLDQANEQRLHVEYVDDYEAINDDHFWIGFIRYRHETGSLPNEILAAHGDTLGEAVEANAPGHKVILIPVQRRRVQIE